MAVTRGHGNPDWTKDETILALDVYLQAGKALQASDERVIELSSILNVFPWPEHIKRNDRFRNPDGVAFKLINLESVKTGRGLKNNSRLDRQVWADLSDKPHEVHALATQIRSALHAEREALDQPYIETDVEFFEGRLLTEVHRRRERHPGIRRGLIMKRRKKGQLCCEICAWTYGLPGSVYEEAAFEAHHLRPLGMQSRAGNTSLSEMALLCATCHRLVHRAIAFERRWLTLSECRAILKR
jgi:5-methylcytosine-specific restriction protein A